MGGYLLKPIVFHGYYLGGYPVEICIGSESTRQMVVQGPPVPVTSMLENMMLEKTSMSIPISTDPTF